MIKRILLVVVLMSVLSIAKGVLPYVSLYSDSSNWDVSDSLLYLPAYDDYCHWERSSIWGKRSDLTKMKHVVNLSLIVDSCQFHPPSVGRVTSGYGWRSGRPHYGIDVKVYKGDTVSCVFDGVVRIAKYSKSYGYVVVVRHSNGLETLYAHLSKLLVKSGNLVEAGSRVGLGGNTGRSFGSHLHFEVRYLGEPFDPSEVFSITDSSFALKRPVLSLDKDNFALAKRARMVKYHRVRSGDSLWRIAKKYKVSISKLCKLNKISRKTPLRIGKSLRYN